MSVKDELIGLLNLARENLEQAQPGVEMIRQQIAQAAGYLHQAGASYYEANAGMLSSASDEAAQCGQTMRQVQGWIDGEIAVQQRPQ